MEEKNMTCQEIVDIFMGIVDEEFNAIGAKAKKMIMTYQSEIIAAKLALFLHENEKYKDEDKAALVSIYVARLIIFYHLENISHIAKKHIFEQLDDDELFEKVMNG